MSYRTFKRLLGETSLERKCRFLFGGGLLLLISGSFYFYAWLNKDLVIGQNEKTARMAIVPALLEHHWDYMEPDKLVRPMIKEMGENFPSAVLPSDRKPDEFPRYRVTLYKANPTIAEKLSPDSIGDDALKALQRGARQYIHQDEKYEYYAGIYASKSCVVCHNHRYHGAEAVPENEVQDGDLIGMAKVTIPLESTRKALARNNAILLTTAIVTACLAMLAAYLIVRYVIVKPVLHLKDISDEIARGTLDLRADIRTGDEFEELSHAFNRMLRHLTTIQDELRDVNTNLDAKVDELAQVNLKLYEMNKLKDEFLATMSHELRTPLNSILGFSDVLTRADNLSEKQQRFMQNIQTSGKDLMLLINDLLDLAKIESGKMELQIVEFPLAELVEQQVASMMPMASKKNIDLTSEVDPQLATIVQDAGKIQQILNNLLSNAVKFTPEGGRVRVRAAKDDDKMFAMIVEDTGIGIPLEDQETIFEKFRQGRTIPGQKDTMTREYGGTGLGLSIVKELSKLLGGEVLLQSEFGKGSTFTVRLPMSLDQHPQRLDAELHSAMVEFEQTSESEAGAVAVKDAADSVSQADATDRDETAA